MPTCPEIEPLITPYVDGEATSDQRAAVSDHLHACPPCRRRASEEGTARRILRERAAAFHVAAPSGLRARCQPARRRAFLGAIVRPIPVWATAAVVIVVFVGVFYVVGRGSTALAAELAIDHVKCFALFERASGPGDSGVIAQRMKNSYGWTIAVPASVPALGLQLVGGRRCFSMDGRVAHIMYRHLGHPLSLFVVPSTSRDAQQLAVMGHEAVIWSRRGTTFVVLAREPKNQVAQVAAYIQRSMN